jgi:hypothetical protein
MNKYISIINDRIRDTLARGEEGQNYAYGGGGLLFLIVVVVIIVLLVR